MKINTKIYTKSLFISLMIVGYVIEISLQGQFSVLSKYDEFCAIIAYLYLIYLLVFDKMSEYTKKGLIIIGVITLIGFAGNFYWGIQTNIKAIATDLGIMFKVFAAFFASYEFFRTNKNNYRIQNYLNGFCRAFVIVGFLLAILNLFVDIGMHTEYVYGMRAFHYILVRVGNLNAVGVACLIVLTGQMNLLSDAELKKQKMYIVMAIFLLASTLRTRAFTFIFVYVIGYFVLVKKKSVKIKWRYVILMAGIIGYVAYPKIMYYFVQSSETARSVLLRYGIVTAMEMFPLGAGLGSYGTHAAREYWTPLYNKYDFEQYYGLSKENGMFLVDNYWPAIAGEFGWIGVLLIVMLLIVLYKTITENTKDRNIIKFVTLFGFVCLLIASTVSSSFFNYTNMLNVTLIGLQISNFSQRQLADIKLHVGLCTETTDR